jgi:HEAT repeat protein
MFVQSRKAKKILVLRLPLLLLAAGFTGCKPTDNVKENINRLNKQDPKERRFAAEALGDSGDKRGVEALIARLLDQDYHVRTAAALALGNLKDVRALEPLIDRLKHGYFEQAAAGEALVRLGEPAVEPLILCLKTDDASLPPITKTQYKEVAAYQEATRQIASLEAANGQVTAANALGKIGDKRALMPLIACLKVKDRRVLSSVSEALANFGASAVQALTASLKDEEKLARVYALKTLIRMGKPAEESLAEGLSELGNLKAVELLISCMGYEDRDQYTDLPFLTKALAKFGDSSIEPLILCLKDQKRLSSERSAAVNVLSLVGGERAIAGLVEALPDWYMNVQIGAALKKLEWKPRTDAEKVYFWICSEEPVNLVAEWSKTKEVLMSDVRSENKLKIENAINTIVSLGKEENTPELCRLLYSQGDLSMATIYLNCGHPELKREAISWAADNGYKITSSPSTGSAKWGRWGHK